MRNLCKIDKDGVPICTAMNRAQQKMCEHKSGPDRVHWDCAYCWPGIQCQNSDAWQNLPGQDNKRPGPRP